MCSQEVSQWSNNSVDNSNTTNGGRQQLLGVKTWIQTHRLNGATGPRPAAAVGCPLAGCYVSVQAAAGVGQQLHPWLEQLFLQKNAALWSTWDPPENRGFSNSVGLNHHFLCWVPEIFLLLSTWIFPSPRCLYHSCPQHFIVTLLLIIYI